MATVAELRSWKPSPETNRIRENADEMREKCDFSSPSTLDNHLAVKTRYMTQELYFHDRWRVDPKKGEQTAL